MSFFRCGTSVIARCISRSIESGKPLYYGWLGRTFVFGSELKALPWDVLMFQSWLQSSAVR